MKHLIFLAPIRLAGGVACRVPGCRHQASAHVDIYARVSGDQSWDARASGPYCHAHLDRMKSGWEGCEVRGDASVEHTLVGQSA